jgi:putative endonuclease
MLYLTLSFFLPMNYTIYIIQSKITGRYYCGQTCDLQDRLTRHNNGESKSTKSGCPWNLIWTAEVATRSEAVRIEAQIKKRGISRYLEENKN